MIVPGADKSPSKTAVILGSYRKHLQEIAAIRKIFISAGYDVPLPSDDTVIVPSVPFVRFKSDGSRPDEEVEINVLLLARRADIIYFYLPDGYIGRTACYELGVLLEAGCPVYASNQPVDLPVRLPESSICTPEQILGNMV